MTSPGSLRCGPRGVAFGGATLFFAALLTACDWEASRQAEAEEAAAWPPVVLEDGVVEHLLDWRVEPSLDGLRLSVPAEGDEGHLLATSPLEGVFVGPRGEEPSLLHPQPGGDWLIDFAEVADGWVAIAEHDEDSKAARLWLYDLAAGDRSLLVERDGSDGAAGILEISLDAGGLAWNEPTEDGGSCVRVLARGSRDSEVASCSPSGTTMGRVFLRGPVLSWIEYGGDCSKAYSMVLHQGDAVQVDNGECAAFQVVSDRDTTVWFEFQPGSPHVTEQRLWGLDAAGEQVPLGVGAPGSATLCDGRAYWKREPTSGDDQRRELRAWDGLGDLEVVYRSPSQDLAVTSLPTCRGDRLMVARTFTGVGDSFEEILSATYR